MKGDRPVPLNLSAHSWPRSDAASRMIDRMPRGGRRLSAATS